MGIARPRVIRGTQAEPLPLLPSGSGGVCSRPLHEARGLTTTHAITRGKCSCSSPAGSTLMVQSHCNAEIREPPSGRLSWVVFLLALPLCIEGAPHSRCAPDLKPYIHRVVTAVAAAVRVFPVHRVPVRSPAAPSHRRRKATSRLQFWTSRLYSASTSSCPGYRSSRRLSGA